MDTKIITVDLGLRSYDIYTGAGLLFRFSEFVPVDIKGRSFFLVTDTNVKKYADIIKENLMNDGAEKAEILMLQPGEQTKSFRKLEKVIHWMLENGIARDSMVVAVGGGVIGDLTGFAAATVMRGVPFIQVPTTLLAQVDSSVGGKTGINVQQGKNLVGNFYQPSAVVADIETLETLPKRELLAGYAEVLKYALINNSGFFTWLEENVASILNLDGLALSQAIEESVRAKAHIVESDEKESGRRALLNLGHTFAHALEAAAGYDGRLLHGEAVAIGMVMAFDLSVHMGVCDEEDRDRVQKHISNIGLPTHASMIVPSLSTNANALLEIMRRDKKVEKGKMTFIIADGIGEAFISQDVPEKLVKQVLIESLGGKNNQHIASSFGRTGVKGLWKSAFSSRS